MSDADRTPPAAPAGGAPAGPGRADASARSSFDRRDADAGEASLVFMGLVVVLVIGTVGATIGFGIIQSLRMQREMMAQYQAQMAMTPPNAAGGAPIAGVATPYSAQAAAEIDLGMALLAQSEPAKAQQAFRRAFGFGGGFEAELDHAIARLNQSEPGAQEQAIQELQMLLGKYPDHPELARVHYCIGIGHAYLGRPADALPEFEAAASRRPDDATVYYQLAQALEQLGRTDEALPHYERSFQMDPFLRSALLGIQRIHARAGRDAEAAKALERFMALEANPRSRLTEFKYTRMGELSQAIPLGGPRRAGADGTDAATAFDVLPSNPLFEAPEPLPGPPSSTAGVAPRPGAPIAVDLDGDALTDLFVPGAADSEGRSVLLRQGADGGFERAPHALAEIPAVRFASFADFDDDGRIDALVSTSTPPASTLWRLGDGEPVEAARWPASNDALWVDLDHDGDLDLMLALVQGPPAILMNRGAEGFERLGETQGLVGLPAACRRVAAGDLNGDGLLDLALLTDDGCQLWINDGFWNWRRDPGMAVLEKGSRRAMVIGELPSSGEPLVVTLRDEPAPESPDTLVLAARVLRDRGGERVWHQLGTQRLPRESDFELIDLVGDGSRQVLASTPKSLSLRRLDGSVIRTLDATDDTHRSIIALGKAPVPALVEWNAAVQQVRRRSPSAPNDGAGIGGGPTPYWPRLVPIELRGRTDPSQSMRSNADGVGARWTARANGRWNGGWMLRTSSTAGQGRQPTFVGVGRSDMIDALFIDWPDGVIQSEAGLRASRLHTITETQRQISSCPLIFVWDGDRFDFATDCLGVGGMGYLLGAERDEAGRLRPVHAPPTPRESVRLIGRVAPKDGAFEFRLAEPMEEACYLDSARLVQWRVPSRWRGVLDERLAINGPPATGAMRFYRDSLEASDATLEPPIAPVHDDSPRVRMRAADLRPLEFGPPHPRFIGRLRDPSTLTLTFPEPIDSRRGEPALVLQAWVEYPYSQTSFAMWQEHALPRAPSIDALDPATNEWVTLVEQVGYPAGMRRESLLPLTGEGIRPIPAGCTAIRIRTSVELYIDRLRLVWLEPCPDAQRFERSLLSAELAVCGYPRRVPRGWRRADYDYAARSANGDCRVQPGFYTRLGDCTELVRGGDGALAIFGPGEEIRLRFDATTPADAPQGGIFVLELEGWCKDMDRYTGSGATLEPLPVRDGATPDERARAAALHSEMNTRLNGGR